MRLRLRRPGPCSLVILVGALAVALAAACRDSRGAAPACSANAGPIFGPFSSRPRIRRGSRSCSWRFAIALPTAPLTATPRPCSLRALALATICLLGWIALTALHIGANLYLMRFRIDIEDNLLARKHVTQVRVLLRALDTVIVLVTLGFALMTFDAVRQYGVSLFASAGVAGVVFGLAAQPVLSNLIAGVQLAVTQPIRLEDAVTVQNEYGWIEEINATYVVIRLWDLRRLIVPLNFFIQQPFYNWTRQAAANDRQRPALSRLRRSGRSHPREGASTGRRNRSSDNAKVSNVQVTNTEREGDRGSRSAELRQCRATTANLCADLREKLIGFLQQRASGSAAAPAQRDFGNAAGAKKAASHRHVKNPRQSGA